MAGIALRVLKPLVAAADTFSRSGAGVVVLAYHRVGAGTDLEIDLTSAAFERQMEAVSRHGVVTLSEAVELLRRPDPEQRSVACVTFDDGTADFADHVVPILVRHRVPATLYVATQFVDEQRSFPHDGTPLSWGALGDAVTTGLVEVGSHTHSHALLDRIDPVEVDNELARSCGLIEERLGVTARHFAYPKGLVGTAYADQAVRRCFASAAVGGTRVNRFGSTDVHRLARSPIQVSDGERWFQRKLAGGMTLEDTGRRLLNRVRYLGARS
jgi:peptidoglycan/xylan/chitin deacetylase (PgdA/CDA1 family)